MPTYAVQRLSGIEDLKAGDLTRWGAQAKVIDQNWKDTQANIRALSDDLRSIPFAGGSAESSASFADKIETALGGASIEGLVGLSQVAKDSSEAALSLERTLFSWKGAAIAGSAVFALVALGWWLKGRQQAK